MLDRYITGTVHRQSPEAPVPVLLKSSEYSRIGGAANVALNVQALGSKATLIGVVGNDDNGILVKHKLDKSNVDNHLVIDDTRVTTVKERYLNHKEHLLRVDQETSEHISSEVENKIVSNILAVIHDVDGVILSDYNKGMLTSTLILNIIKIFKEHNKPVFVDPKFDNYHEYKSVNIFKPNKAEMLNAISVKELSLADSLLKSATELDAELFICTLGGKGMACVKDDEVRTYNAEQIDEVDVCGAGDTVISILSVGYLSGLASNEICELANVAGKIACLTAGVANVSLEDLQNDISRQEKDIIYTTKQ